MLLDLSQASWFATSSFIAGDPVKTTLIFRRFDQLVVRNLLFLEARHAALEELQDRLDETDKGLRNNEPITTASNHGKISPLLALTVVNKISDSLDRCWIGGRSQEGAR